MSIWRWADKWDSPPLEARLSLGEGDTPLIRSRHIGPAAGLRNLFFKLETATPTGSYKDRFAAAAISHMRANKQQTCIATSSGNTGAALAAYCAAAKIRCRIAIVETAPQAKLQQMLAYGADIFRVKGFGTEPESSKQSIEALKTLGRLPGHQLQISAFAHSPKGMEGVESISLELAEQTPKEIEHVFSPAGGGGLTLAVARGFTKTNQSPAIHCAQPEGNNTIAGPLRGGSASAQDVQCSTDISGLQVATVIDGHEVIQDCRSTGGTGHLVSDGEVWAAQKMMARDEGIFSEPAGAVALAAALKATAHEEINPKATIICLVTGSGFKDVASVARLNKSDECPLIKPAQILSHGQPELLDKLPTN